MMQIEPIKPEVEEEAVWSIGIYSGDTLLELQPPEGVRNPVISAEDVRDIRADFVADPFMIKREKTWHMFFEVMNSDTQLGEIGLATSDTGMVWQYQRTVLKEPFHLSYPYVFCLDGEHYMIPETLKAKAICLYRGDPFPYRWSLVGKSLEGAWSDPSIFFSNGLWWMFASPASPKNDRLELFYADDIRGPWRGHAMNPIIQDNNQIARPAGRVTVTGGQVIRFAQRCYPSYGMSVRAFEIAELTPSSYREQEIDDGPVLYAGAENWNRSGMHHIDPHFIERGWLACVDGWRIGNSFRL